MNASVKMVLVSVGLTILLLEGLYLMTRKPASDGVLRIPSPSVAPTASADPVAAALQDLQKPVLNAPAPPPVKPVKKDEYLPMTFDQLSGYVVSFPTEPAAPEEVVAKIDNQIPDSVKGFGGKKITIKGYLMPYEVDGGKVKSFILSRVPIACCMADGPKINEWIQIDSTRLDNVPRISNTVVQVEGLFEVGAISEPDGYVPSIFRMIADFVEAK